MGWKSSTIIINSDKEVDETKLLNDLGFVNLVAIENEPFEVAINPKSNNVYIGKYKGNTLICVQDLPYTFLQDSISYGEEVLFGYYYFTEICSIVLHSTINLWGYSISKDGEKIRARIGSSEDGTVLDYGNPLEEEKDLLSKSTMDGDGNRAYRFDDDPDEIYDEDQIGEDLVFEICRRYFDEKLDVIDDLLFETELKGFHFDIKEDGKLAKDKQAYPEKKSNPWTKYLIIVLVVLVWKILRRFVFN